MSETSFKTVKHGIGRYKKHGCRCDICVAAQKESSRKRTENFRASKRRGKLPAEPLIALLYDQVDCHSSLGRKIRRWRYEGIDPYTADKLCCEMGYHPFEVFGDAWWKGAFDD